MIAYGTMLVLLVICFGIVSAAILGRVILEKEGKWKFKPEPIKTHDKVSKVVMLFLFGLLSYFATIGISESQLATGLFIVQMSISGSTSILYLLREKTKDEGYGRMIFSLLYLGALIAGYVCLGIFGI